VKLRAAVVRVLALSRAGGRALRGGGLDGRDRKYFLALVRFEHEAGADKEAIMEELRLYMKEASRKNVRDVNILTSWLHGVVYEMAHTEGFAVTVDSLAKRLGHVASRKELEESLAFLKERKWLVPTGEPDRYRQNDLQFEVSNDVRRIDYQKALLRFLEIAKHRLTDDVSEREFQALTIAVPLAKVPVIKEKIREFVKELWAELDGAAPPETVVHILCCAFKVSTDPEST